MTIESGASISAGEVFTAVLTEKQKILILNTINRISIRTISIRRKRCDTECYAK